MNNFEEIVDIFEENEFENHQEKSKVELPLMQEQVWEQLRKTKKKLKKAKKKGRNAKKLKKKYKSLKRKYEKLSAFLQTERNKTVRGRWDTTIEKSVPEFIRLATAIIDRKLPPSKGGRKKWLK